MKNKIENQITDYELTVKSQDLTITNLKKELDKCSKSLDYHKELAESLRSKMNVYLAANNRLIEQKSNLEIQLSRRNKNWIQRFLGI